ncbi:hypothetical protein CSKR_114168 [Clonorchis sinensis]|uniref:Uncharacterized protein n=1 Tax=Clonorchis sinensis TaxID=79923 RepID=A0A419PUI4_CLOSI|nr:hypothetical protein CSKR_114168 [Clonorchis sinensis]
MMVYDEPSPDTHVIYAALFKCQVVFTSVVHGTQCPMHRADSQRDALTRCPGDVIILVNPQPYTRVSLLSVLTSSVYSMTVPGFELRTPDMRSERVTTTQPGQQSFCPGVIILVSPHQREALDMSFALIRAH